MKRSVIIMSLLSLLSSFSCANHSATYKDAHIVSFSYHYDGTIGGNSHRYKVDIEDGVPTIHVTDMLHHDYGEMIDTLDADFMQALEALCAEHDILRWDGYDKYDRLVCDGHGFSLYVRYDNGKSVNAHGMNMTPAGFWDFDKAMHELFAPVCQQISAKALQKKIAAGVSGDLRFILMNFMQRGKSGSDRYEVQICRSSIRTTNFDVHIRSVSGEFFPVGDFRYYASVPDDQIDWAAFAKLVDKHHLTQWMDYDKAAEDYNNAEWFQIGWSFERGHIDACGTEHPKGYEAFRKDFLKLLVKAVEKAKPYIQE